MKNLKNFDMTQEEKDLLLKDLCARLPYGVKVQYKDFDPIDIESIDQYTVNGNYLISLCKPYLKKMSSMTEEEKDELISKCLHTETEEDWEGMRSDVWGIEIFSKYDTRRWDNPIWPSTINMDAIDWFNAHHFDYRGLISMGLALEAPEEMYNIKTE